MRGIHQAGTSVSSASQFPRQFSLAAIGPGPILMRHLHFAFGLHNPAGQKNAAFLLTEISQFTLAFDVLSKNMFAVFVVLQGLEHARY